MNVLTAKKETDLKGPYDARGSMRDKKKSTRVVPAGFMCLGNGFLGKARQRLFFFYIIFFGLSVCFFPPFLSLCILCMNTSSLNYSTI